MATDREKREAERFPVTANTVCVFASPITDSIGPVRIKNISNTGIGLMTTKQLDMDTLLAVKLENPAKNFAKTLLVRVIHVTPQAGGIYLIGGALDSPLTYEELCAFVM